MSGKDKYIKLTEDLIEAYNEAWEQHKNDDDGGTCNFDSPTISLEGYSSKKLEPAIRAAGFYTWKWKFGGTSYVIGTGGGQGNRRTSIAEDVCRIMKDKGYKMGMYYAMD